MRNFLRIMGEITIRQPHGKFQRIMSEITIRQPQVTLLVPFEKDSLRWMIMPHINIHDGITHTLNSPTLPVLVQTFEMVFQQYHRHPESKSFGPDGTSCKTDSKGLLKRYPVTATAFHLI